MAGHQNLQTDVEHLANKGRIVVFGNKAMEKIEVNCRGLMQVEGQISGFMGHF